MPKHIDYQLTPEQRHQLAHTMNRDPRPEVRQRATSIHLLSLGHSPKAVATMLAVSVASIYLWHNRWRQEGIEGLANQPKSGRHPIADEEYKELLRKVIEQDPQELGYGFTMWTAERLVQHMARVTGKTVSRSHLRVLLKKNGFVYRRPKHDLTHLQNKAAKEQALELIEELKKKPKTKKSSSSLWMKPP